MPIDGGVGAFNVQAMSNQDSFYDLRKTSCKETAILLEEIETYAIIGACSASSFLFLLDLIKDLRLSFILALTILCGFESL